MARDRGNEAKYCVFNKQDVELLMNARIYLQFYGVCFIWFLDNIIPSVSNAGIKYVIKCDVLKSNMHRNNIFYGLDNE
jgi:hypothetical protein